MSIDIRGLSFSYCTRSVLTDISFTAENGRLLAVMGPNGVGKTTLFRCILGLLRHYTGSITIDGIDAAGLSAAALSRSAAYIPQIHEQTFGYTVMNMVLMGATAGMSPFASPGAKEKDAAREALVRLGIERLADKNYTHISGGEQQLVLIARALAQRTSTLIMDEPTSSLDYGNRNAVLSHVRSLTDDGYCVIMSTHDPQQALWYADDVLALLDGRTAAFGKAREVITSDLIKQLYGIDAALIETDSGPVISPRTGGSHV